MGESPIERQQRTFHERSKQVRPAKTAGGEYLGVLVIVALFAFVVVLFVTLI